MTALPRRLGALALTLALGACSVFGGQAAEEPPFETRLSEPPFEIRAYPPIAVARTVAEGSRGAATREGFGRLFDYISGANTGRREIAMTAPVVTEAAGEEIAMTAPVVTEEAAGGWAVAFVLPEGMTAASAPAPTDPKVEIAEIPAREVAVVRFSGFFSAENIAEARADLAGWLERTGRAHAGDWQAAGYNPPWTLPWLRRNEVWVTLAGAGR